MSMDAAWWVWFAVLFLSTLTFVMTTGDPAFRRMHIASGIFLAVWAAPVVLRAFVMVLLA